MKDEKINLVDFAIGIVSWANMVDRETLLDSAEELNTVIDTDYYDDPGGNELLKAIRRYLEYKAEEALARTGEWRCRCPSSPAYDTNINPHFVAACSRCGAERPKRCKSTG